MSKHNVGSTITIVYVAVKEKGDTYDQCAGCEIVNGSHACRDLVEDCSGVIFISKERYDE